MVKITIWITTTLQIYSIGKDSEAPVCKFDKIFNLIFFFKYSQMLMVIYKNIYIVPVFMKRCITLKKLNADWCHYIQFHLSPFILIPCDMTHQKQLSTESELSWHKKKNIAGVVRKRRWWLTYRSIFLCRNKASLLFQDFFFF